MRTGTRASEIHLVLVGCLLALCSCGTEPQPAAAKRDAPSRFALTPDAQRELNACVDDQLPPNASDSEFRQTAYLCEAELGIGSEGTVGRPWAELRGPDRAVPSPPPAIEPTPVPAKWRKGICNLERGDGERELVRFLGAPDHRTVLADGGLLLQWESGAGGVSAKTDRDGLREVKAIQENRLPKVRDKIEAPKTWQPDVTRLSEVEAVLGEGLLIVVGWDRGLPIPREQAQRQGIPDDVVTAGCSLRYAWPHLDTGFGPSLRFRDGVLKGVL